MGLTQTQSTLLYLVVQRFNRQTRTTYLDPMALEEELDLMLTDLAADVDALETAGYVARAGGAEESDADAWLLVPTDKGFVTVMGDD